MLGALLTEQIALSIFCDVLMGCGLQLAFQLILKESHGSGVDFVQVSIVQIHQTQAFNWWHPMTVIC